MNTPEAPLSSRRIFMRTLSSGLAVAGAAWAGVAETVRAEGIQIIDNPNPPVLASGKTSAPFNPISKKAGVGYTVSDPEGPAYCLGWVSRASGRTDLDPQGQLRAEADAKENSPDIASTGFCTGAAKFAVAGPLIQGGIYLFGKYINEFNRKGAGTLGYSANSPRQLEDGSFVDFGSSANPMTPREYHILVRGITEQGIAFVVNTKTQRYGLPWMKAAFEVLYSRTRFSTISGVLRTGDYLNPGQEGLVKYMELPFEYRLNVDDPNDSGTWLRGNDRIWAGFQVNPDVNVITANKELASTRNLVDMDALGLILGTKVTAS